ncbi:MAG: thioredoxin family protein [Deltaproteobacteria bacterium]
MTTREYTRIRLGNQEVGLVGLNEVFEELAESHATLSNETVRQLLVRNVKKRNYIPASAEAEYGRALVREFRKFLGYPDEEEPEGGLIIKVLGPGCSQCDRLTQVVTDVLSELKLPASLEHLTDLEEIANYGFVRTPALVVNDKVVMMGRVPLRGKIKELLAESVSLLPETG